MGTAGHKVRLSAEDGNSSSHQARLVDGGFLKYWKIKGAHDTDYHQTSRIITKLLDYPPNV